MTLQLAPYSREYDREVFDCGVDELNGFLKLQASQHQKKKLCSITLLINEKKQVMGFYSISPFALQLSELPTKLAKKFPRDLLLPCWLIGKLALDESCKGLGMGAILLADALTKIQELSYRGGGYCAVVDAKSESVKPFYEHFGFRSIIDDGLRLYIPLNTL